MKENEFKNEKSLNILEKIIIEPLKNKPTKISSFLNILSQLKASSVSDKEFNENISANNNNNNKNKQNIKNNNPLDPQVENKFSIKNLL